METTVVFVHGWSVTHTNTYGHLPARLINEASRHDLKIKTKEINLGRYISFHDEVRVKDIARAFEAAVLDQLKSLLKSEGRFVCITHSTGGPVIREWWRRYYQQSGAPLCPMSHLIMLAPANYGSALAVLGKGKLSRLNSWRRGVEPGQGVLDWLALGSDSAWKLNMDWIESKSRHIGPNAVFPFVLTGQSIDRAFYDSLNSYTGELGSDGVVRVAAANLQAKYVRLVQQAPVKNPKKPGKFHAPKLVLDKKLSAAKTPLKIVAGKSHSGDTLGIMKSVKAAAGTKKSQPTVDAIFSCIKVQTKNDYDALAKEFDKANVKVQDAERLEVERRRLRWDTYFIHDQFSMAVFRMTDHEGYPVTDFDLILTAGPDNDPNHLPPGFFADRQLNGKSRNTVTYYFNHSIMTGCDAVMDGDDEVREKIDGTPSLGFKIIARPDSGFAHYMPCSINASAETMKSVVTANATTMVDIVLRRVVGEETFRLDRGTDAKSFKGTQPGAPLAD